MQLEANTPRFLDIVPILDKVLANIVIDLPFPAFLSQLLKWIWRWHPFDGPILVT